ncbi:MAG: ABC transporter permease [Asticcacaulis sp.]|uniref:ABC transporter permease n=1 Tax=Asticcacaulis sp. TaxID=1872648 RepID=UPI0039E24BB3
MTQTADMTAARSPAARPLRALSTLLWRLPGLRLTALGLPPSLWFLLFYLIPLAVLIVAAFWSVDSLTGALKPGFSLHNFQSLWETPIYHTVIFRTIGIAAAVTFIDILLAFPVAYWMGVMAGPKMRAVLGVCVLIPLWSSYLARVYAWRLILSHDGILNWLLRGMGLGENGIGYSNWAMTLTFTYLWLPFMILPIATALERVPRNLLEASADLGGHGFTTLRRVVLPLALPGMIAGSIFTFSLTLGDYVTPILVGGPSSDFIGNVIYKTVGVANDIPFAAALAVVPLVVMGLYLWATRVLDRETAI